MKRTGEFERETYNLLDLPQRQTTGEGTVVDYKYAFDGRKLQEKVTAGTSETQRDYSGEFLYEGGVLKRILFDGGYVEGRDTGPVYMFFLRDHLGSVRAVVSETGAVQQMNHYFPYGDLFPNTSNDSSVNRYKYTGKESGDEIGLYDFSARFLHTRFGRFTTIDPLAEKYPGISPYAYCNCNPVNFVDPDGRKIVLANGVSKKFKDQYTAVVKFMISRGTAEDIAKLEASSVTYYISPPNETYKNIFVPKLKTIFWSPDEIIITGDYINMSPATVLAHEAAHASEYDRVKNAGCLEEMARLDAMKKENSDPDYGTLEERRIITGTEQEAARKHGEIRQDQVTRRNHNILNRTISVPDKMTPEELSKSLFEQNNLF